jgi:two-component system sensor histidine kinase ChvG
MDARTRAERLSSKLLHSFSLKLLVLAAILLSVPIVLYWQFQREKQEQLSLAQTAASKKGRDIAEVLRPHFASFRDEAPAALHEALAAVAIDNTNVKVLLRPPDAPRDDFVYIASNPPLSANYLRQEAIDLVHAGIFERLAPSCDRPAATVALPFVNPAGQQEILTSITPVHVGGNCWVVVTSQNAALLAPAPSLDPPFWTNPAMRAAATTYFLSAILVIWLFAHLWRNVSRFRKAARRIRMRGGGSVSFYELNTIPELARVAEDFDSLVGALTSSQTFIAQAAEENAHAFKTPLAVIAQSLEPLRRAVGPADAAAQRSLQGIERSVVKLDLLVAASRDMARAAADIVYPVRRRIDLSACTKQLLHDYASALASQGKRLAVSIPDGISAYVNEDMLEVIIENLLENAASFTPAGGTVEFRLEKSESSTRIRVADRGPGVDPAMMARIFDRYVSLRAEPDGGKNSATAAEQHEGLGLWIVKRNVEGLGGTVTARNRDGGGFEIVVDLKGAA